MTAVATLCQRLESNGRKCDNTATKLARGAGTDRKGHPLPAHKLGPYQEWVPICDWHALAFDLEIPGAIVFRPFV